MKDVIKDFGTDQINDGQYTGPCFVYRTKKNDCLDSVSSRYSADPQLLRKLNGIEDGKDIVPGRPMLIPYR